MRSSGSAPGGRLSREREEAVEQDEARHDRERLARRRRPDGAADRGHVGCSTPGDQRGQRPRHPAREPRAAHAVAGEVRRPSPAGHRAAPAPGRQRQRGAGRPGRVRARRRDRHRPRLRGPGGVRPDGPLGLPGRGVRRAARRGSAAQRDPGARPQRGQLHAVGGGLRPVLLRGHVLRPDEDVLRGAVARHLLSRRRRHRVGQGALQPGPLRP